MPPTRNMGSSCSPKNRNAAGQLRPSAIADACHTNWEPLRNSSNSRAMPCLKDAGRFTHTEPFDFARYINVEWAQPTTRNSTQSSLYRCFGGISYFRKGLNSPLPPCTSLSPLSVQYNPVCSPIILKRWWISCRFTPKIIGWE